MKKSNVILSTIIVILLLVSLITVFVGCDLINGGGTTTTDTTDTGGEDETTTTTTKKPTTTTTPTTNRPTRPTKPTTKDPDEEDGPKTSTMKPLICMATLIGGSKVNAEEGNYKVLNFYADLDVTDKDTQQTSKKRFIFRANLDQDGIDNELVIKVVDMSNVKETPVGPVDPEESGVDSTGSGDSTETPGDTTSGSGDTTGSAGDNTENSGDLVNQNGEVIGHLALTTADMATQITKEEEGELQWGFYVIGEKMYLDKGENSPLVYFEDFNMDYMIQLVSSLKNFISDGNYDGELKGELFTMLDNLIKSSGLNLSVSSIIGLVVPFIFGNAVVKTSTDATTGAVTSTYTMEVKINALTSTLKSIVGMLPMLLGGSLSFDLDLDPLLTFIDGWLPSMTVQIEGTTVDGVTTRFAFTAKDKTKSTTDNPVYLLYVDLNSDTIYQNTKADIGISQRAYNCVNYTSFSLTNIAFSLDITLNTQGALDVGSVANSVLGKTLLPEGVILVDGATGFRLEAALDLDLNYGKDTTIDENGKEVLVDNNLIMLELYLIDVNGNCLDSYPMIAVYYKDGALYVNLTDGDGNGVLSNYFACSNIKVNLDGVPSLVQYVVNLVTNALDNVFSETLGISDWTKWEDILNARYTSSDESTLEGGAVSTSSEITNMDCISLVYDENGNYQVSTDFITLLKGIGSVVGFGDIFSTNDTKTAIEITLNDVFWKALTSLAGDLGFSWPKGLTAGLSINFQEEGHIDSITIAAGLDSRSAYIGSDDHWYIGTKAAYKSLVFVSGSTYYSDSALTSEFTLVGDDVIDNYSVIYVNEGRFYIDSEFTKEVVLGKDENGSECAFYGGAIDTNIKSTDVDSTGKKYVRAFVYKDYWVVGYGLDKGEYITTAIATDGLEAAISVHDIMICYTTEGLKKFNPDLGGTSYSGYFGAKTNLEGYILSKTHRRVLATGLTSSSTGDYYVYSNTTKEYTLVSLGTGEGQVAYNPETDYYIVEEKDYVDSVSKLLTDILGGTFVSLNLSVEFSQGAYNLAPLIALFGLDEIKEMQLLWEFTSDFALDVSLNIGLSLDKENSENSILVVELVTNDSSVAFGANEMVPANTTIFGIYGVGNHVYIELENLKLLNIVLPNLAMDLDYTSLIYGFLGDKEILDLTFDLSKLLGLEGTTTSTAVADEFDQSVDISNALAVLVNEDIVAISVTVAAIQELLGSFNIDLGMDLSEVFDLTAELVASRSKGLDLTVSGALIPKWTEETGNYFDDDLKINVQTGTTKAPIQIGSATTLKSKYETKTEKLAAETAKFHDDLIDAIIQTIGDMKLTLTLDAEVLNSIWDINKIVDNIVAKQASSFNIPIEVDFDDWKTQVQVVAQLHLNLDNFKQTQIKIEVIYEGNVWLGVYIYNNSVVLDLNGLGLFDVELVNVPAIAQLGTAIQSILDGVGDLSLTSIVGGLIKNLTGGDTSNSEEVSSSTEITTQAQQNAGNTDVSTSDGDVSTSDGDVSTSDENTSISNNLAAIILSSLSIKDTTIFASVAADVFDSLFRELLGYSLGLDLGIDLSVDILAGKIALNAEIENSIWADVEIALEAGGDASFDMDLDQIPDWNATKGEYLIKSILKNLELGLYIDLNQYTSTTGSAEYTRIYIEKLDAKRSLSNTDGKSAAKGSILVTIADIDETEFNNTGAGTKTPLVYVELDYTKGKMNLTICNNLIKYVVDVGSKVGTVSIDLDLVSMLSGTLDGVLDSVNSLVSGLIKDTNKDLGVEDTTTQPDTSTSTETTEEEDTIPTSGSVSATQVVSTAGWTGVTSKASTYEVGQLFYKTNGTSSNYSDDEIQMYNGSGFTALSINTSYTSPKNFPTASSSNLNNVYRIEKTTTDDSGNSTTTYKFYICKVSRHEGTKDYYDYYDLNVVSGISALFSSLDITSLIDLVKIYLSVDQTTKLGIMNLDVEIDSYNFNSLIDNLMYYIFGQETILNLAELASGTFSSNYLASVYWNRIDGGATFDDLMDQVPSILADVLKNLAGVSLSSGLISMLVTSSLENQIGNIVNRFIPFAVTNETHLGLNLVRGQLTNIYLTNQDHGQAVTDDNGNVLTFYNTESTKTYSAGRSGSYFTNVYIFNTSNAVGDSTYTGVEGAITWDQIPATVTYDPYLYSNAESAYNTMVSENFTNKEATYQKGQSLYKASVSFKITGFQAFDVSTGKYSDTITSMNKDLSFANLDSYTNPGIYYITATAPFNSGANTATMTIKLKIRSSASIEKIETLSMHVYESLPEYIMVYTTDGVERRLPTSSMSIYTKTNGVADSGIVTDYAYCNADSKDGGWEQTVYIKFTNGVEAPFTIKYLDSTIVDTVLSGASGNKITIDLYNFDSTTSISDYTPSTLYFKYSDGTYGFLDATWDYGNATELFDRFNTHDVSAAQYEIRATVMGGTNNEQTVTILFDVPSKKVTSVAFGEKNNTLDIQPYEYYLYLTDSINNEAYNPYQTKVTVNYDEGENAYQGEVNVVWSGIDSNIDYKWNNNNDYSSTAKVSLDETAYASGNTFNWEQDVKVSISRNEISAIYFDKELTKQVFTINPYEYNNLTNTHDYYPSTAYVKFTNDKVLELPIAWDWTEVDAFNVDYMNDYTQFTITIGFDVAKYNEDGTVTGLLVNGLNPFYQQSIVNAEVDGTAITGLMLSGSDYMGGTYQIDPVSVNFLGSEALPSSVTVVYENGTIGTMDVAKWDYDFKVTMTAQEGLVATCWLTNDLSFNVNVEILDRSVDQILVDTTSITSSPIDPYSYTMSDDGTLTYDIFESQMDISWITSYTVKLVGVEDNKVYFSQSVNTSKEVTALRRELRTTSEYNYNTETKMYEINGVQCKYVEEENTTTYNLPVYWDLTVLNISPEGGEETIYYYLGYGEEYQIQLSVDVEFATKVVDYISAVDSYYQTYNADTDTFSDTSYYEVLYNGEGLTAAQKRQGNVQARLLVYFTDGTSEYVDCEIDLTSLNDGKGSKYGYQAGIIHETKFEYTLDETVAASTKGVFYVKGKYNSTILRGNGNNDTTKTYYSFTEATDLTSASTGSYYFRLDGMFYPVTLTGTNYSDTLTYYTREVAVVDENTTGTFYTLDETSYQKISKYGAGAKFDENTDYYRLTVSDQLYANVTIGTGSGTLEQTSSIMVFVTGRVEE